MSSAFEEVCTEVRSLLNSSKDQMTISALTKDYVLVMGSSIPFRKLGYQSVEELLRDIPNLRLNRVGKEFYIDMKPDEKTAHIAKLVQEQKSATKKKRKGSRPPPSRTSFNYRGSNNNRSSSFRSNNNNYRSSGSTDYRTNNSRPSNTYNNNRRQPSSQNHYDFNHKKKENEPRYVSNYRSSTRTQYDFSDPEDDYDEMDGFREEYEEPVEKFDIDKVAKDIQNLRFTVNNSTRGAGRGNSSMSTMRGGEIRSPETGPTKNPPSSAPTVVKSKTVNRPTDVVIDLTMSPPNNSVLLKTSPSSVLAAARNEHAATKKLPSQRNSVANGTSVNQSVFRSVMKSTFKDVPFKPLNSSVPQPAKPFEIRSLNTPVPQPINPFESQQVKMNGSTQPRSENSMPTHKPAKMVGSYVAGPINQPLYEPETYCQKLYAFTVKHLIPLPVFSNFHMIDPRTKEKLFMSQVKAGGLTFPDDSIKTMKDLCEAQEIAACEALKNLTVKYEKIHSDLLSTTTERQTIIDRIAEIVSKHPTGLKSDAVEQEYADKYLEKLPTDWLNIAKSSPYLSVETLIGGVFVYPRQDIEGSLRNVNKLPPLVLPEEDVFPMFITTCLSTTYVYFRIITDEYTNNYLELVQMMEELYEKNKDDLFPAEVIKEGNYYAARLQGEWFRVKVLSPDLGETYRVSLVDHGDTDEVLKESIFDLKEELTTQPAQAIRCGLTGLEQFHNNEYVTHTLNSMTQSPSGKGIMAEVNSRDPHLMITIYDTVPDVPINLNEAVKQKMDRELTPPRVPSQSGLVDVYLTRVKEDGGAHVQIISDGLKRLMSCMVEVKNEMLIHEEKYRIKSVMNLIGEKIILAKYHGDGMWHRAVVKSLLNDNESAQVHFIDYGNIEIISIENLAVIKHFEYVLTAIPPQAIEVQITRSTRELFTQSVIEFLMSLAQATDDDEASSRLFLMKVINSAPVPDVEFFLRDDNNELVRLNNIIGSYYSEYRGMDFEHVELNLASNLNSKTWKPEIKDDVSKSFCTIPPFPVPDSTDPFPVYVSMIVNPGHFVVQPLEHREELLKMTDDMRRYYTKERPQVDIQEIKVGNVFAVENDQKIWCRGRVIGVLKELSSVSFKCLDYMDIVTVDFKNIHPLMPCFRRLPALAIRAELAGILPVHNDWDMHDCVRFHELLAKKEFISVVVDKSEDVVSMMLFDTSVQPERDIGAFLVEEERAIDVTKQE